MSPQTLERMHRAATRIAVPTWGHGVLFVTVSLLFKWVTK